jgi:hypothetical protein
VFGVGGGGFFVQAHLDSAVFRLCRIYDQDDKNLGLRGFIHTIQSNPHFVFKGEFFASDHFRGEKIWWSAVKSIEGYPIHRDRQRG